MMAGMKACAILSLGVGTIAIVVFGFVGCGGGSAETPPPAAPTSDPAPTPAAAPAPEASEPGSPPSSAAPAPADSAASDDAPEDTRTMEVIAAVVKANRQKARDCYEKGLKKTPTMKGDLVVHFTLKPNGKVKEAELNRERSTLSDPDVVKCVIEVIKSLEYPKSSKGFESTINYPFNFNP
jgi:hypothetical protein